MKLIDLTCPHCNGTIELDQDKEFGFCMYCGHKIYLEINENKKSKNDTENLEKLLNSAIEARDESSILKYCERILELDTDNSDAWYWKGKVALDNCEVESGLVAWRNSVENMEIGELNEIFDFMSDFIAESYFFEDSDGNFDSNIPESILALSNSVDNRMNSVNNDDDEDTFFEKILMNIVNKTSETDNPCYASYGSTKAVLMLLSAVSNYTSVCYHLHLFSSLHEALNTVYRKCKSKRYVQYDSYDSRLCLIHIETNVSFLEFVITKIQTYIEPYSEESLKKLEDYWAGDDVDMSPFTTVMYYAYNSHCDIKGAGFLQSSKIRRIREDSVLTFLDNYFAPLYNEKLSKKKIGI